MRTTLSINRKEKKVMCLWFMRLPAIAIAQSECAYMDFEEDENE